MDFSKTDIDDLLNDVSYLQDEIEALKYVIHTVPFSEKPGGKESILEMVALIDHAQKVFYRPFTEKVAGLGYHKERIDEDYRKSFQLDMDKYETVDHLLDKIVKHRAALLSSLEKLNAIDWAKSDMVRGKSKTIYAIIGEMVGFERNQLKQVADRVMALDRDKKQ